jgi:NTE family protein
MTSVQGPEVNVGGSSRPRTALVLSGGGARGAYQVGVLLGLMEQGFLPRGRSAINVFVGASAGSINAAALAAYADAFGDGLAELEAAWRNIEPHQVFRTDIGSLGRIGVRWAWDLSFGGVTGQSQAKSLLDTRPLRRLLANRIPFERIDQNLANGSLESLALIATDLLTANGVIFLQARPDTPTWSRRRWRIEPTAIGVEHVMASGAIPIFFPPVEIEGRYFGDGSIRNTAPLRPAINLGADRVIAVGVSGPPPARVEPGPPKAPSIAQIAGVLLDAVMLDAIEVDVEHGERVNTSVLRCTNGGQNQPFRLVDILWLRPSAMVREIANELAHRIPAIVRYLMRGLGSDESVTELASYLLFDSEFCGRLIDLGRRDVAAERDRIAAFFAADAPSPLAR